MLLLFPCYTYETEGGMRIDLFLISYLLLVTFIHLSSLLISLLHLSALSPCHQEPFYIIAGLLNECRTMNKGQDPNINASE